MKVNKEKTEKDVVVDNSIEMKMETSLVIKYLKSTSNSTRIFSNTSAKRVLRNARKQRLSLKALKKLSLKRERLLSNHFNLVYQFTTSTKLSESLSSPFSSNLFLKLGRK